MKKIKEYIDFYKYGSVYFGLSYGSYEDNKSAYLYFHILTYTLRIRFPFIKNIKVNRIGFQFQKSEGTFDYVFYFYFNDKYKFVDVYTFEYISKEIVYDHKNETWCYSFPHACYLNYEYVIELSKYKSKPFGFIKYNRRCELRVKTKNDMNLLHVSFKVSDNHWHSVEDRLNEFYLKEVKFTVMNNEIFDRNYPNFKQFLRNHTIKNL